MTSEVYTVCDLALRWKCSRDVVYDLLRQKKLTGFRLGGAWRVHQAEVARYEQGGEV